MSGAEQLSGGEDWDAVAKAIQTRLAETRMTQLDVASRARLSLTTVRELQHNLNSRRRRPQTLAAVSQVLGWPPDHLQQVLNGDQPQTHEDEVKDPVLHTLDQLARQIQELRERVEQIEHQLAAEDATP